jgi:LysM repeat protein
MEPINDTTRTSASPEQDSPATAGGLRTAQAPPLVIAASGGGTQQQTAAAGDTTIAAAPAPIQVPDNFRDPLTNANLAQRNIRLIISAWEADDTLRDDRKLAYILATTKHETGQTMQGIHEGFDANYWRGDYADSGYWGRGFVQLTHERNYENMEDNTGVDLTQYPEAALLPAISAIVGVEGIMDGDFHARGLPLNTYLPATQNAQGQTELGQADWYNARRTVNSTDRADDVAALAREIHTAIQAFRTGVTAGTITTDLGTYLYESTDIFDASRDADALRLLAATGHHNFEAPNMGSNPSEQRQRYARDVGRTGYFSAIRTLSSNTERAALTAFQAEFNRDHNLQTPLPENGRLDDRTFQALLRAGQIQAGNNMIDYAFHGEVQAINPITQAFTQYQAGQKTLAQLATFLVNLMPVPNANDVLGMFDQAGPAGTQLAYELALAAPRHDDLAFFNRTILSRMQSMLAASSGNAQHAVMATRLQALTDYRPPQSQHRTYNIARGDTLGAVASRNGMTLPAMLEYNAANGNTIANPNNVSIGQAILFPNPDFDAAAPVRQNADQTNFPLPAAPAATVTPATPAGGGESATPAPEQERSPSTEKREEQATTPLSERFKNWLKGIFGRK